MYKKIQPIINLHDSFNRGINYGLFTVKLYVIFLSLFLGTGWGFIVFFFSVSVFYDLEEEEEEVEEEE